MNHLERQIEMGIVNCFGAGGGGGGQVGPTPEMIEQEKINSELWDYYNESYKPQIEKYIALKTDTNIADAEKKQITGQVNADVMRKVPQSGDKNLVNRARELTNISSIGSTGDVQATGAARSRELSGIQNVIDIGRGQATTADVGLRELADQSIRSAVNTAASNQQEAASTREAYGSVAGAIGAGLMKYAKPKPKVVDPGYMPGPY